MDTTKIVRGDDLMLFDDKKKSLAFATSHTLTLTADAAEISCKDSGIWKTSVINKLGWEISSENLYCETEYENLFNAWVGRNAITVYFGYAKTIAGGISETNPSYDADETQNLYTGSAIITNLSVNAASGDNSTYSITLQGVGEFKNCKVTSNPEKK